MRKLLILLLSVTVFLSCNNEKTSGSKDGKPGSENDTSTSKNDNDSKIDRNSGKYDDVVDDDEEGNHVADNNTWPSKEIDDFMESCIKNATGRSRDWAESYCSCSLKKMQAKYPDIRDLKDFSMSSSFAQQMVEDCKAEATRGTAKAGWSERNLKDFVDECVNEAIKKGADELDAQSYCDCMQYKLEKIYPDYRDVERLTMEDLSTPSMKKMIRDCKLEN